MTTEEPEDGGVDGAVFNTHLARITVETYNGAQSERKAMMNRVRDTVRKVNEGIPFDQVEEEKDDEDRTFEAKYRDENLPDLIEQMVEEGKLTEAQRDSLDNLLSGGQAAGRIENTYRDAMSIVEGEPIYYEWLVNVYGVSTTLTAKLVHMFGYCTQPERDHVSDLWSYSGYAPGKDRRVRGEKTTYNPEAKTLVWNVADSMVKQGDNSRYRTEFYDPYKRKQVRRMEAVEGIDYEVISVPRDGMERERYIESGDFSNPPPGQTSNATFRVDRTADGDPIFKEFLFMGSPPNSDGHADARARRYLGKKFLKHYWAIARDIKGYPTPDEWVIAEGGHDKVERSFENPFYAKRVLARE